MTPRRTPGGYRLYTQSDVARLRMILRLQRDEFLPLRVIRQELASGRGEAPARPPPAGRENVRPGAPASAFARAAARCSRWRKCSRRPRPTPSSCASWRSTASSKASCAAACATTTRPSAKSSAAVAELARYGVGGRNLRVFRSSADREANLLQQILAPALRSRNPQRRKEALEALENLAAVDPPAPSAARARPAQDRGLMDTPGRGARGRVPPPRRPHPTCGR